MKNASRHSTTLFCAVLCCAVPGGCGSGEQTDRPDADGAARTAAAATAEQRRPLFGNLHGHTRYSFDAFLFGTRATPDDAYRYAKGAAIEHPAGFAGQLDRPLDFYAVTDHALFLGNPYGWSEGRGRADHPVARAFTAAQTVEQRTAALRAMQRYLQQHDDTELLDMTLVRSAWQDIQAAAERHNAPGQFTTLIGYGYSSAPDSQNQHRLVIFRGSEAPAVPYSGLDSIGPEQLWRWMDDLRDQGIESLAIPHDSAGSNAQRLALVERPGDPLDATYAEQRMRNEPLVEITQVTGNAETHPALLRGIALEASKGFNPFQFGFAGPGDSHTGAAALDQDSYFGHAGLTGVWAEANSRAAIYDALRRKETFATSGPRLVVRLFAGFGLPDGLHRDPDMARAGYAGGVAMGGDLMAVPGAQSPRFVVSALRDPRSAPLQRLQIVKGWVQDGEPRKRVYDVACSDGLQVDPATQRCPDNGAEVDLSTCQISADVGASELATTWQDPDFRPGQEALYYLRAMQNPTCRWSSRDPLRAAVAPPDEPPRRVQEQAWSSPIWYHGSSAG